MVAYALQGRRNEMSEENFWILMTYLFFNTILRNIKLIRIEKKIDKLLKRKEEGEE